MDSGPRPIRLERVPEALLIVDLQVDFCPGGALPVAGGDDVVAVVNSLLPRFRMIVASRDWHPAVHVSFSSRGGPWPAHCVRGTPGAALHPELDTCPLDHVVDKGGDPRAEAYSAFDGTDLATWLWLHEVVRLYVVGLATEYCVRQSVLDALAMGFQVVVVTDAVAAVDVEPGDGIRALAEMDAAGAILLRSADLSVPAFRS